MLTSPRHISARLPQRRFPTVFGRRGGFLVPRGSTVKAKDRIEELGERLKVYEANHDFAILPGLFAVARLDGRNFTRLAANSSFGFKHPHDERFRDIMVQTTEHLMRNCGLRVPYACTHSDEISLLMDPYDNMHSRRQSKWLSTLAGEASAKATILFNTLVSFDCRLSLLPRPEIAIDYFSWRSDVAARNALNAHCYFLLLRQGKSARQATQIVEGASIADKNEILYANGINFNDLPAWEKRGVGLFWQKRPDSKKRTLTIDQELSYKTGYRKFLQAFFEQKA